MRDDSSASSRGRSRGPAGRRLSTAALAVVACIFAVLMVIRPAGAHEAASAASGTPIYLDRSYTYQERAADLVARLTPAQRASQLVSSQAPEISEVANPLLLPTQAV